jgi:hypothetical protein
VNRLGSPFTVKVVGMTFTKHYPGNLYALDYLYKDAARDHGETLVEPIPAVLIRNPDNEYDANAIEVHVPSLGEEMAMIGHIPAGVAERLAPELDGGGTWSAGVEQVLIHPDHPDNPGISLRLERVEDSPHA